MNVDNVDDGAVDFPDVTLEDTLKQLNVDNVDDGADVTVDFPAVTLEDTLNNEITID